MGAPGVYYLLLIYANGTLKSAGPTYSAMFDYIFDIYSLLILRIVFRNFFKRLFRSYS